MLKLEQFLKKLKLIDGVYKSLGSFDERELAELVAEEGRAKYHKEFANA